MRLWQHKNGTYYILYGPDLKRRISTRTRDRGQAAKLLDQFSAGMAAPRVDQPTFGQLLDLYEAGHKGEVRAKVALTYGVDQLKRHLGSFRPEHLLPSTWKQYAHDRVGPGTILREVGVARAAFSWNVAHRNIAAAEVPVIQNPVRTPRPREIWIPRHKAPALIQACTTPHVRLFVKMGLMTLARSAAILECRWAPSTDAEGRVLPYVNLERRLVDYGEGFGNKRRALVPINDELLQDLQAARRIASSGFVIEYRGDRVGTIKNAFKAAVAAAGLPSNITPHILRHTGCTWLVEDGVSYEEIGKMAGDTAETIERVYGHHSPAFLAKAAASLQLENRAP
jgi:integrase